MPNHIISVKEEVLVFKISSTKPFFIEEPVAGERAVIYIYICVRGISLASVYTIFQLNFGTVPTVIFLVF